MVPVRLDSLEKARGSRRHRSDAPLVRVSAEGHRYVVYHEGASSSRSGPVRNGRRSGLLGLLRLTAFGALAMLATLRLPAAGQQPWAGPVVTQSVLSNGLRVVVIENHVLPLVHVAMWYRFGSVNEPPGHLGIAHALEHMMFRGTRTLSGTGLDLVDARLGIESNAETDYEDTHYYQTVPAGALAVALRIEADRMRGLTLRPRDWALERQAVLAELAGSENSDVGMLQAAMRATAFGRSPYAHDPIGTMRDLRASTAADLRRAYDAGYQPDNAVLVVTGDVQPAAALRLVRSLFGSIRGHAHLTRPAESIARRGFVIRRHVFGSSFIDVALEAHGLAAPDGSAEEIAMELLQPAHAALREPLLDRGPCDSYSIDDERQRHGGLIHIVCRLDDDAKPATAVSAIRHILQRLGTHVPAHAVEYARRGDKAATNYACDSLEDEANNFGGTFADAGIDPRTFDRISAALPDAAIVAVLRRWANPVAIGIAIGDVASPAVRARKPREERISSPAWADVDVEPAWARIPLAPYRTPNDDVEAFALPNGVRVFVEPRRGNGTVYLRGGFDRVTYVGDTRDRDDAIAERHAIDINNGRVLDMHGFAPDFSLLLRILSDVWRPGGDAKPSGRQARAPQARHAWIAVTGDIDPETVRAAVTRRFGNWTDPPAPLKPQPSPSPHPFPSPGVRAFGRASPSVTGFLALPAPERGDPDFGAMTMLDAVLGREGDFDTRLVHEVRVRRGLVYGIDTYYYPEGGLYFVHFNTTSTQFSAARTAVRDVLSRARIAPITADERTRAYNKLLAEALRDRSTPDGVLDTLADAARKRVTPEDIASLAARYGGVTAGDIERVANKTMRLDRITEFDEGRAP
jgi:predicted Zn-dependent peptidase